jgi:sarcosine oxidase, subunit gamma
VTVDERARDPLAHRLDDLSAIGVRTGGGVIVEHVPFLTQVDVRMDAVLVQRAPYPLPTTPNTAWEDGPRAALWLGPDEWLVLGPPGAAPEIAGELEGALDGLLRSIVDVSANRVAIELSGPRTKEVLSKGCALDLHPRSWRPGMCAQTMLARAQVILHERSETTRILVRPSFADYLVDWLIDAAAPSPATAGAGERTSR